MKKSIVIISFIFVSVVIYNFLWSNLGILENIWGGALQNVTKSKEISSKNAKNIINKYMESLDSADSVPVSDLIKAVQVAKRSSWTKEDYVLVGNALLVAEVENNPLSEQDRGLVINKNKKSVNFNKLHDETDKILKEARRKFPKEKTFIAMNYEKKLLRSEYKELDQTELTKRINLLKEYSEFASDVNLENLSWFVRLKVKNMRENGDTRIKEAEKLLKKTNSSNKNDKINRFKEKMSD